VCVCVRARVCDRTYRQTDRLRRRMKERKKERKKEGNKKNKEFKRTRARYLHRHGYDIEQ